MYETPLQTVWDHISCHHQAEGLYQQIPDLVLPGQVVVDQREIIELSKFLRQHMFQELSDAG